MKLTRNLISLFLMIVLICSLAPLSAHAASGPENTTDFAGGHGTADSPYLVATKEQLNNVRNYRYSHFRQTANIYFDASDFQSGGKFYNGGKGWTPIGADGAGFSGTYNGDGYTISGLTMTYTLTTSSGYPQYLGLFGYVTGDIANVKLTELNFKITKNSVSGAVYLGGVAGFCSRDVLGCSTAGQITLNTSGGGFVAGVVADGRYVNYCTNSATITVNRNSTVTAPTNYVVYAAGIVASGDYTYNCTNNGKITSNCSSTTAGGITASTWYISDCVNNGNVTVDTFGTANASGTNNSNMVGGIVGQLIEDAVRCINNGAIVCSGYESHVGGIAGWVQGNLVDQCKASGSVTTVPSNGAQNTVYGYAGGIVGTAQMWVEITNCYGNGLATVTSSGTEESYAGGIVGWNMQDDVVISHCYTITSTVNSNTSAYAWTRGGIIGYNVGTVSDCYYRYPYNGVNAGVNSASRYYDVTYFKDQSIYKNFDFTTIWKMGDSSYPYAMLRMESTSHKHSLTKIPTDYDCLYGGYWEHWYCSDCNTRFFDSNATKPAASNMLYFYGHKEISIPAVAATCSTPGLTEGFQCTVCKTYTVPQTETALAPHTPVIDAAVAATCTSTGLTEGSHCDVCKQTIVKQTVVGKAEHTPVLDPAVTPTCTSTGLTEGYHCGICSTPIVTQIVLEMTDHTPVVDQAVPATCTSTGLTEGSHCGVCSAPIVEQTVIGLADHTPVIDPAVPASCTSTGLTEGSHCGICSTPIVTQIVLEMTDHTPIIDPAVPASCTSTGLTEGSHCGVCSAPIVEQTVVDLADHLPSDPTKENDVPPTATDAGSYDSVVYCTNCSTELSRETIPVPATGPIPKEIIRISGKNRTETAIAAADVMMEELGVSSFDYIIIASGINFADALSGSYLAVVRSAPILLHTDKTAARNQEYVLSHLTPGGTVYLLGGTGAVPGFVQADLENANINVVRLSGPDRFATNIAILKEAGVTAEQEILVCTGYNFADSLSASATARPILLVNSNKDALTKAQVEYLEQLGYCNMTIIGGESAVSLMLADTLKNYGTVDRLSGKTRYVTSILIAEKYFSQQDTVFIAYGQNFPDGLCGGPLASIMGAPLLLTQPKQEPIAAAFVESNEIYRGYILGGTGVISEETVSKIFFTES